MFSANLSHISDDGKEWTCKTCDRALARGSMPLQAKANQGRRQLLQIGGAHERRSVVRSRGVRVRVPGVGACRIYTHNARIAQLRAHADFAKLISRTKLSQMIVKPRKRRMFSPSNVLWVGVWFVIHRGL